MIKLRHNKTFHPIPSHQSPVPCYIFPIPNPIKTEGQSPHAYFHISKAVTRLLPLNILSVDRSFARNTYELPFIRLSEFMTPHTRLRNLNTITQL
ncbi:MAG: hypothetical protein RM368_27870 [Nostoc sp. DedSLP03]|uniref:hypothetical protein n=1 Tax=Nostoc sp. DedSLP03 TaxID=3075400 RepID=UPI002AD3B48C|nr:hypothetical protein [Nostoc sp. DedSLP03]MDZ7968726.1 hypothetical protein [Nostoc sp. DedSLP03]